MFGLGNLFIIFLLLKVCDAIDYKPEEGVLELNPNTFDAAIADNKFILIEFYTPWCQYCQRVRPEFVKAAQHFLTEKQEMRLAAVDVSVHKDIKARFGIRGVPAFRFFIEGRLKEYKGGQTADAFITWLKQDHYEL